MACIAGNPNCNGQYKDQRRCSKCGKTFYRCGKCGAIVPGSKSCSCKQ